MRNLILSSYHSPILHLHYQRYQRKKNTGIVTHSSHPNVSLPFVEITGRTKLSGGISETRENKNIAASRD
uniref:Uncharacterized protein LOC105649658 n=1 Tax=Rhizophora mucronata TaxID=61149 RepID=A0A2P2LGB6_RHIMU